MQLLDLSPVWLCDDQGARVAIMFRCPCCLMKNETKIYLTCFFKPIAELPVVPDDYPIEAFRGGRMHRVMFYEALKAAGHQDPIEGAYSDVVSCIRTLAWARTGDTFDALTCTPSIDASASGHWHGFIAQGQIR